MDQIFVYNKTYQDRLREYNNILGGSKLCSVSDLKKEWSLYLELTMDPNGWQAIWRISRLLCEELNIEYPTLALVYVDLIDFKDLTASICVLSVQNHVELPSRCNVSLMELSITKEQDSSVCLNLESTANCLDMVNFFFTHIIMPWDYVDEDTNDWLGKHLALRLRLFYDMHLHIISLSKSERLERLLNKARRLQALRVKLESKIEEDEDNIEIEKLLDIHVCLMLIRSEVELLANPLYRNILDEEQSQLISNNKNWIVFHENDTIEDQIVLLNRIKDVIEHDSVIHPVSKVTEALQYVNAGSSILFNKGIYGICETADLPHGIVMKGQPHDQTILSAKFDDIFLNCSGSLVLENLTLDVNTAQCGVLVHTDLVILQNCKIIGDGKTSTHRGIIVLGGGKLKMINCHIASFHTAIVGYSGSSIVLQNCTLSDVTQGLKIFDKCSVLAEGVSFSNCKEYGIWAETEELLSDGVFQQGNFALLEMLSEVKLHDVTRDRTGKDDAIIVRKFKLKPIVDLFSNPDLDPTIIHDESNDKMNMNISIDHNDCSK